MKLKGKEMICMGSVPWRPLGGLGSFRGEMDRLRDIGVSRLRSYLPVSGQQSIALGYLGVVTYWVEKWKKI